MKITNECCMKMMSRYPDKYFDLAIVDPPYGIGISNRNGSIGQKKGQGIITRYKKSEWDNNTPDNSYFEELFRVSKNQIIWGGNYFKLPLSSKWIVWDKGQPEGVTFAMFELAWQSDQSKQSMIFRKTFASSCNKVANNKYDAIKYAKIHPAQKPVELYKWLLDKYAKSGDKIIDTHLGSGSIAIACHDYGFDFTGCELDKEYFDDAMKRINDHTSQQKLIF